MKNLKKMYSQRKSYKDLKYLKLQLNECIINYDDASIVNDYDIMKRISGEMVRKHFHVL